MENLCIEKRMLRNNVKISVGSEASARSKVGQNQNTSGSLDILLELGILISMNPLVVGVPTIGW
jgi:hypothetical protein